MIRSKKLEEMWTDKSTEFKGIFKTICDTEDIHLYTTENETGLAFPERNIR